jgi:hypothetical protein
MTQLIGPLTWVHAHDAVAGGREFMPERRSPRQPYDFMRCPKLADVYLNDHLGSIGYGMEEFLPTLRETTDHALTIAHLAKSDAPYGADRAAVVLFQESADKAVESGDEIRGGIAYALNRFDGLEREGLK